MSDKHFQWHIHFITWPVTSLSQLTLPINGWHNSNSNNSTMLVVLKFLPAHHCRCATHHIIFIQRTSQTHSPSQAGSLSASPAVQQVTGDTKSDNTFLLQFKSIMATAMPPEMMLIWEDEPVSSMPQT
jgi:hypothetical protein